MFRFDLLQWNCRGLRTHSEDLKLLFNEYDPGVVCLQETKLGDALYNPGLNYEFYKMCPADGERAHGGVAIVVSKSVQHSLIPLTSNFRR